MFLHLVTHSLTLNLPNFVILSEAKDLLFSANSRSFASLRMTIHEWCSCAKTLHDGLLGQFAHELHFPPGRHFFSHGHFVGIG